MLADWLLSASDLARTDSTIQDLKRRFENARGAPDLRRAYFEAVDFGEIHLSPILDGDTWIRFLHTDRYWDIQRTSLASTQPANLINSEIDWQVGHLDRALSRLRPVLEQESRGDSSAIRAVLDTNVHLHYKPLDQIDWPRILDAAPAVRLVVPLVVIGELDGKKNSGGKPSSRAAGCLKLLRQLLADGRGPEKILSRPKVTIEVPLGFDALDRSNADAAILTTAASIAARPDAKLRVITGDYSMQLRATAMGLGTTVLDDDLRLPL